MQAWLKLAFGGRPRVSPTSPGAKKLTFGFAVPAAYGGEGYDYYSTHNSGLFSNCSTTLEDILALSRAKGKVARIDYSQGMGLYKDRPDRDVYPRFFERNGVFDCPPGLTFNSLDVHTPYSRLPLAELHAAVDCFFKPSGEAEALAKAWADEARLDLTNTLAIYYRGTDKGKEIELAPIEAYLKAAREIDDKTGRRRAILIQTDQMQAREAVVKAFGARARFFSAMPVTRRAKGIHKQWLQRLAAGGGEASGLQMLAAVLALSRCAEVVLTTSNVGAWVAFYRGHARGLHQFSAEATLIGLGEAGN